MAKRIRRFENERADEDECPFKENADESRTYRDLEFLKCDIIGAGLCTYGTPKRRASLVNVKVTNSRVNSFPGIGAIFDEVVIDGLKTSVHPVILDGCAFRHVVLKGVCGRFLLNRYIDYEKSDRVTAFDVDNARFYEGVDWALDISNVRAAGIELRGCIPARLVRRNPDEQFIMTREVALSGDWNRYAPPAAASYGIDFFAESGSPDDVFVAARRSRSFKEDAEFFHRLKSKGLVT